MGQVQEPGFTPHAELAPEELSHTCQERLELKGSPELWPKAIFPNHEPRCAIAIQCAALLEGSSEKPHTQQGVSAQYLFHVASVASAGKRCF